jgi:hypothetical protein
MYLNVKRGCGVSYHQERLWCIVMLETVMVYRNVRGSCGIASSDIKIHHNLS